MYGRKEGPTVRQKDRVISWLEQDSEERGKQKGWPQPAAQALGSSGELPSPLRQQAPTSCIRQGARTREATRHQEWPKAGPAPLSKLLIRQRPLWPLPCGQDPGGQGWEVQISRLQVGPKGSG